MDTSNGLVILISEENEEEFMSHVRVAVNAYIRTSVFAYMYSSIYFSVQNEGKPWEHGG